MYNFVFKTIERIDNIILNYNNNDSVVIDEFVCRTLRDAKWELERVHKIDPDICILKKQCLHLEEDRDSLGLRLDKLNNEIRDLHKDNHELKEFVTRLLISISEDSPISVNVKKIAKEIERQISTRPTL